MIDVSVNFAEDIMQMGDNAGIAIQVDGPSGASSQTLQTYCLNVSGGTMAASVEVVEPGTYTVTWRSVSSDGHNNSGTFDFKVTNTSGYKALNAKPDCVTNKTAAPLIAPPPNTSETSSASSSTGSAASDPFLQNLPFLLFGILLITLGAIAGPLLGKLKEKRARDKALAAELRKELENEEK